jgi:hypothetical protein
MAFKIQITIGEHALVRANQRGASESEIRETVFAGEQFPAKKKRIGFRRNFVYKNDWEGKYFENKQLEVYAAEETNGWYVVTVITKFF